MRNVVALPLNSPFLSSSTSRPYYLSLIPSHCLVPPPPPPPQEGSGWEGGHAMERGMMGGGGGGGSVTAAGQGPLQVRVVEVVL